MSGEGATPGQQSIMFSALRTAALSYLDGGPDITAVQRACGHLHPIPQHRRGNVVLQCWLRLIFDAKTPLREMYQALLFPLLEDEVITVDELLSLGTWNQLYQGLVVAFRIDEVERVDSIDEHGALRLHPHTRPGEEC